MIKSQKIGRNDICPKCNSGKKYKHCCGHHSKQNTNVNQDTVQQQYDQYLAKELRRKQQQGQGRPIISTNMNGKQIVFVGNTIHYSEHYKTFVDFLCEFIKGVFARDDANWGTKELRKPLDEQHPILQWYRSLCNLQKKTLNKDKKIQEFSLTNAVTCYIGLAYNLYLLQHNVELQNIYIKRLKDIHNFQGAYYELIVAGCLIRAGFKLELEDETNDEFKHCEFSATSQTTGKKYWVEAKARGVKGVLGKINGTNVGNPTSKLSDHIKAAFKKPAPDDRLIFVDVNTPIENQTKPAWIDKAEKKLKMMESDTDDTKKAYIFVTNMGFHWLPEESRSPHAVMAFGLHISDFSKSGYYSLSDIYRAKKKHIDAHKIMEAFQEYPAIPTTFDGQIPSVVYNGEEAPPTIGKKYIFKDSNGAEVEATVTTATINKQEKTIWIGLDNGMIIKNEISDRLLQDYNKHPDTFFGIINRQGKSFEKDDTYGFFERLVEIHMDHDDKDILEHIKDWPNQNELKKLSHEELVLIYCEGLIASIRRMENMS